MSTDFHIFSCVLSSIEDTAVNQIGAGNVETVNPITEKHEEIS